MINIKSIEYIKIIIINLKKTTVLEIFNLNVVIIIDKIRKIKDILSMVSLIINQ